MIYEFNIDSCMSQMSTNVIVFNFNDTGCKSLVYTTKESLPSVNDKSFTCYDGKTVLSGKSDLSDALANPVVKLM